MIDQWRLCGRDIALSLFRPSGTVLFGLVEFCLKDYLEMAGLYSEDSLEMIFHQ